MIKYIVVNELAKNYWCGKFWSNSLDLAKKYDDHLEIVQDELLNTSSLKIGSVLIVLTVLV